MLEVKKRTILVVDDTPEDIAILNEALRLDYRVLAATNHASALSIARTAPQPDLILLDILMPEVDGYRLCRTLKDGETTRDIPVIFVTVKDAEENEAAGFEAGCVDYITKPVSPSIVRARVRTHLELKRAREELQRQNEVLRENARLHADMEAVCRHDLKNPLMAVLSVPSMLLEDPGLTDEQRDLLRLVEDSGQRMLSMINSSVDLYRMETGTYAVKRSPVDVTQSMKRIGAGLRDLLDSRQVCLRVECNGGRDDGAPFTISGEELLVYSMLSNLVKNAVEASPSGAEVIVRMELEEMARISIHNQGAVPAEIRPRFFEKGTTAGKENGTGLGAYSARLAATTLGGKIQCATSDSDGTTITIELPRA